MKIAFIGGGNMANSLIGGLIADGFNPAHIAVVDVKPAVLDQLAHQYGVQTSRELPAAVEGAAVIAICVKPQSFKQAAQGLTPLLSGKLPLIVSIAAGIRTRDIARWLREDLAVVRAMPNTPALVQAGAAALYANDKVTQTQKNQAESLIRATGIVKWVDDENLMDVVTALSGSGPAYFFRIMESMIKAAENLGLPAQTAHLLTIQTALGAAKMALESNEDIATLRQRVTSPGGTTEQGLITMNNNNIDQIMYDTINAAYRRSIELAEQLGES